MGGAVTNRETAPPARRRSRLSLARAGLYSACIQGLRVRRLSPESEPDAVTAGDEERVTRMHPTRLMRETPGRDKL
jgi:hypothetical protein